MIPEHIEVSALNKLSSGCMIAFLGIEFTQIGQDFLAAKMPVDHRTKQPFGLLHGGASVVLAETLGSCASAAVVQGEKNVVGMEINANHIGSATDGYVHGLAKAVHLGKRTHIWSVEIKDDQDKLICISRLTVAVLEKKESND